MECPLPTFHRARPHREPLAFQDLDIQTSPSLQIRNVEDDLAGIADLSSDEEDYESEEGEGSSTVASPAGRKKKSFKICALSLEYRSDPPELVRVS